MDTVITVAVDWKAKTLHVNGEAIHVDDVGGAEINVSEILAIRSRVPSVLRLQNELQNIYIKEQIIALFNFWGGSNTITIRDTANALNVDKRDAIDVIKIAVDCDVLARGFNSAWKVRDKMIRESLLTTVNHLRKDNRQMRGVDEVFKEERERMRKLEESEEAIVETTIEDDDEPAKIVVGMKGVAVQPTRKVIKASQFTKTLKHENVVIPKKKPLVMPSQGTKKSSKPAKR